MIAITSRALQSCDLPCHAARHRAPPGKPNMSAMCPVRCVASQRQTPPRSAKHRPDKPSMSAICPVRCRAGDCCGERCPAPPRRAKPSLVCSGDGLRHRPSPPLSVVSHSAASANMLANASAASSETWRDPAQWNRRGVSRWGGVPWCNSCCDTTCESWFRWSAARSPCMLVPLGLIGSPPGAPVCVSPI